MYFLIALHFKGELKRNTMVETELPMEYYGKKYISKDLCKNWGVK